jgi:hypothetical protein
MKDIANFIVSLFKGLKLSLRWLAIILTLLLITFGLLTYENFTGHFYFSKLEKKVTLVKELQLIANEGVDTNKDLFPIYESAVDELAQYNVRTLAFPHFSYVNFGDPVTSGKAISGASVWLLILVVGVSSDVKKAGKLSGTTIGVAIVIIVVAVLFAWIGTIIPTVFNPWVNYIGLPVIQLAFFYLFSRRKKTTGT